MITGTRKFSESPLFVFKIMTVICATVLAGTALLLSLDGLTLYASETEMSDGTVLLIILAVEVFMLLVTLLSLSFTPSRKIICQLDECGVWTGNFWNKSKYYESFRWNEIADTELVEEFTEADSEGGVLSTYFFQVYVDDRIIRVLNLKLSRKNTIAELIEFFNKATPHLSYVWEKTTDFGNRQVICEIKNYSKVARI